MIWVVFAAMTGLAVFAVLWPLSRSRRAMSPDLPNIALYEAQVGEIDRDISAGLIHADDAPAAKAEAARRLLAVSAAEPASPTPPSLRRTRLAAIAALVFIPSIALALYSQLGRPGLPDAPLSARLTADPAKMDLAAALVRIEAHLRDHPDDGRGFDVVAPVYLRMGRTEDARRAFGEAIRLLGDSATRRAGLGEALVLEAQGIVTADARRAFEAATAADPSLPLPRYYLGLAAAQDGDPDKARAIWSKLADEAAADAPWAAGLRDRIAALDERLAAAPSADAGQSIASLPPPERAAAIRSMVEGLSARLRQGGGNVEEWLRLARAYSVLNEPDKARAAIDDARKNLSSDAAANARLDRLARELGIEG
ncbi:MAG: c-type cytochrome biogenesis protein CcmI [Beijerinckiaceae bacterium]